MRNYSLFCNFCGNPFEVSRWDGKTCSHGHRTRLARMGRFSNQESKVWCIICGRQYAPNMGANSTVVSFVPSVSLVPATSGVWCSDSCHAILNDMKIYGMTEEIVKRIKAVKKKSDKEESIVDKIFKRPEKK